MKHWACKLFLTMILLAAVSLPAYAQVASSSLLTGVVVDQSGAVIPGANVVVKNEATGAEYKATTAENGTFMIPSLTAGSYSASVSMAGFKQSVTKNIVLVVGVPTDVRIVLQVGGSNETVTVTAGADVIQATSATVATTMSSTQITNLPLQTRNALDFLVFFPGATTTGSARNTTFMGLSGTFVNITVDGINTQDNYNKNSDGFYTMITVRPDSIQEVTVTTAAAQADASGGGAIQVKWVTRSGTNDYHGSLYDYERNWKLNSNYWFNNRDGAQIYRGDGPGYGGTCTAQQMLAEWDKCRADRNTVIVHQAGGRFGGPVLIPKLFSGKDRAFFFINLEKFLQPTSYTRNNTIYAPTLEQGIYSYVYRQSGQPDVVKSVDLMALAAANGYTATIDPNVQKLLAAVRKAAGTKGSITSYPLVGTDPNYQNYKWMVSGTEVRNYVTTRFDINLTSKHRIEASFNGENRKRDPDNVNNGAPRYPGFPNYGVNTGIRGAASFALRSTITPRLVNELRGGFTMGTTLWYNNIPRNIYSAAGPGGEDLLGGYSWTPSGMTGISFSNGGERRNSPMKTLENTLTWSKGAHNLSFGVRFEHRAGWLWDSTYAPSIGFGIPSGYDPAYAMFDANNGTKNFPQATTSQISSAATLYAALTARVTSISSTAYLDEKTGNYVNLGDAVERSRQRFLGTYVQDAWRMSPNFTLNMGLRWEINFPWTPLNHSASFSGPKEAWGLSGVNSLFKPGATGGILSQVYEYKPGSPAYDVDYKAFAPSVGFAWSPNAKGILGKILGTGSQTVIRAGFGVSYNNYGVTSFDSMFYSNPGSNYTTSRSQSIGNFPAPGVSWPVLFRNRGTIPNMLSSADFPKAPTYPIVAQYSDSINAFEPNIRTPYTLSWQFSIQREITKDTALEVRYAATRTMQNWFQSNLNETVLTQNGFLTEFLKAQGNLYANIAAGKGNTWRYDASVSGTQPLPIFIKYLSPNNLDPNNSANYTSAALGSTQNAVFTNATYVNYLAKYNANPGSFAGIFYGDATRRNNAISSGLPANFFMMNPQVQGGGAWIYKNGGGSRYDSMVVELRRRLSHGLLVQASYSFSKAFSYGWISWERPWQKNLGSFLRHQFKPTWVYELPFGQGRMLFANSPKLVDRFIGGWEVEGTARIQSGNINDIGNYLLVGMTDKEFRDSVGVYYDDASKKVWYLPKDIRDNSYLAWQYNQTGFTSGAPTGRYIAPANSNSAGCIQIRSGDCTNRHLYFQGPGFARFDLSLVKRIRFGETRNFELRGEFLNAFNNINFSGFSSLSPSSLNLGLITSAYTDVSNSQDPGGRLIQIVMRINF